MAELKTKLNEKSVKEFLSAVTPEQKSKDCFEIVEIMRSVTKLEPKMWGTAIVGFGAYHYKFDSGHEGDMCRIGFSPRKQNITLYVMGGPKEDYETLLAKLGKHKVSGSCLHINKLSDVDTAVLKKVVSQCLKLMDKKFPR